MPRLDSGVGASGEALAGQTLLTLTPPSPIVHLASGSSTGITHYQKVSRCPRLAFYASTEGEDAGYKAEVGTLVHAFLEQWHTLGLSAPEPEDVRFERSDRAVDPKALATAIRVFRRYRSNYAPGRFGRVIGTELKLSGPEVEHAVGISPYTARLDLLAHLSADHLDALQVAGEPGTYVVDHKTTSSKYTQNWDDSLQFTAYMIAAQTAIKTPISGTLVNVIAVDDADARRDGTAKISIVPFPTQHRIAQLRSYLAGVATILNDPILHNWPNITACNFPTSCYFLPICDKVVA